MSIAAKAVQNSQASLRLPFRPADEIKGCEILPGCDHTTPREVVNLLHEFPETSMLDLGRKLWASHEKDVAQSVMVFRAGVATTCCGVGAGYLADLAGYSGLAGALVAGVGLVTTITGWIMTRDAIKAFCSDNRSREMLAAAERAVPGASPYTRQRGGQMTPDASCLEGNWTRNLVKPERRHENHWYGGFYPNHWWRQFRDPQHAGTDPDVCSAFPG